MNIVLTCIIKHSVSIIYIKSSSTYPSLYNCRAGFFLHSKVAIYFQNRTPETMGAPAHNQLKNPWATWNSYYGEYMKMRSPQTDNVTLRKWQTMKVNSQTKSKAFQSKWLWYTDIRQSNLSSFVSFSTKKITWHNKKVPISQKLIDYDRIENKK